MHRCPYCNPTPMFIPAPNLPPPPPKNKSLKKQARYILSQMEGLSELIKEIEKKKDKKPKFINLDAVGTAKIALVFFLLSPPVGIISAFMYIHLIK